MKIKPTFFLAITFALLFSCSEDECTSSCGEITEKALYDYLCASTPGYALKIRNECTDSIKTFCVSESMFSNASIGDVECIEDEPTW
ncbi:MAG: hypothetical protein CMD26_06190 [Flavobacteriales bacterium]|nr:hypothetical protein [Flavobacteriales bacterium]